MTRQFRRIAFAVAMLGLLESPTLAGIVVYQATDVGVGPGVAHPLSAAAAASFDAAAAAIAPASLITFESAPVGTFTTLSVAPGVSLSGLDYQGNKLYINNVPNNPGGPALDGFNTTSGGSNYLEMMGGNATFAFAAPIQFFGAYFTGIQSTFFSSFIRFSDGSTQTVNINNPNATAGGVTFLGFTDAGTSISSVTIFASMPGTGADFIGVDDVRFGPASVPEPSSLALTGIAGLIGLGYARRKRSAIA